MRDETELEATRRSRDSVLANVSHELKTPLSAQMASIQLLQDALGDEPPTQALDLVESLERSTLRLTRLIDNLLESARIESGRGSLRMVPVDLAAVIFEAESMTYPLLKQRGQEIAVELPADLGRVQGDPIQLTQVFVNLISNANKYAPESTAIHVGGASDELTVSVWVEDQGPGIPEVQRASVFEHYYRADPAAAEGMGLGLWIVKTIVERHGGVVQVSASAEGGARFTVALPRMCTP
jgi:signal transduction histidine kinase